ncbi:MAG: Fic family protein [Chthonomonadetes bacterium]|nr:Fic family protein [Chthonomonadetes bacterium]
MKPHDFAPDRQRFLLRVGSGDIAYWAFVPPPLPPQLTFDRTGLHHLSEADRAIGELAGLARALPNPHLLIKPFMRREAVLSSRIEGTQADLADLYAYEAGQLVLPSLRDADIPSDVREVHNYVLALEYGLERVNTLPVSLRLIRELHEKLMHGVRGEHATPGEFRRSQNWIGPPGCTLNEAVFVPPPVDQMHQALDALEKYIHEPDEYPPLVRLALIHYQFEAIHPFLDGNGRVGRLLITLLMVHWNLLPTPLLYLSAFFEKHRQEYYERLLRVSTHGEWYAWVYFFLRGVTEQARDAVSRARKLQDLREEWRNALQQARASALQIRLIDLLFESPILTIPQAQQYLGVTYRSAQSAIGRMMAIGALEPLDSRRYGKRFIARRILDVLTQDAPE